MCRFGTAMGAMETAVRRNDDGALLMIEALLQAVAELEEEANRHGLPLKDYLQVVRKVYLTTA